MCEPQLAVDAAGLFTKRHVRKGCVNEHGRLVRRKQLARCVARLHMQHTYIAVIMGS